MLEFLLLILFFIGLIMLGVSIVRLFNDIFD